MNDGTRVAVRSRAGNRCEYCRLPNKLPGLPAFNVDHIIPRKHGGEDELDNLALACFYCNLHKGADIAGRASRSGHLVPLFHPRQDRWHEHFRVHHLSITGRTDCGLVTARLLNMNETHRLQLRSLAIKQSSAWPGL